MNTYSIEVIGLKFSLDDDVAECLCYGNRISVVKEDNPKASGGVALAVMCKSTRVGYIPELDTLRGYWSESYGDHKEHVRQQGLAVRGLRKAMEGVEEKKGRVSRVERGPRNGKNVVVKLVIDMEDV